MLRTFLAATIALLPVPAIACVQASYSDANSVTVCTSVSACRTILFSQLKNGSVGQRSEQLRAALQAFLDTRLTIDSFPPDDPAKAEDPGLQAVYAGRFFWSDADGNPTNGNALITTHITGRNCVVSNVGWDGSRFILTISVAGP